MNDMKATIDEAGRLTLPEEIRESAGLVPGIVVDIRIRDGVIELKPQSVPRRLVQHGHVTTLEADVPLPPITIEMVNQWLDEMRCEREGLDEGRMATFAVDTSCMVPATVRQGSVCTYGGELGQGAVIARVAAGQIPNHLSLTSAHAVRAVAWRPSAPERLHSVRGTRCSI